MENILQAQKKIDTVFAQDDEIALKAIQEGRMAATIAQQPKEMGGLAVEAAAMVLKGGAVPRFTPVPVRLVTK